MQTVLTEKDPPLISLRSIAKVYQSGPERTIALSGVSVDIGRGEYVLISGRSGSGKSSLLSLIGLLDRPTEGSYRFRGESVDRLSSSARASLRAQEFGFIFQGFNLIPDLTIEENVELPLTFRIMTRGERRHRARSALESVSLFERARRFPAELSGGEQQRVAIARALVGCPQVLLADEPTGNLDSMTGARVMDILSVAHDSGVTVCLVSHDLRYAERATRHVHLADGRVHEDTTGHDLKAL